jgi:hypothetical protein
MLISVFRLFTNDLILASVKIPIVPFHSVLLAYLMLTSFEIPIMSDAWTLTISSLRSYAMSL